MEATNSVEKKLQCSRDEVAKHMEKSEIAKDIKKFFRKLKAMCEISS